MSDVLVANPGPADVPATHGLSLLDAIIAVVHVDFSVEDHEYLLTVVDVPHVRRVGPVQSYRCGLFECGEVECIPGILAGVVLGGDKEHGCVLGSAQTLVDSSG